MPDAYWTLLRLGDAPGWVVWPLAATTAVALGAAGWVAVWQPLAAVWQSRTHRSACDTTQRARRIGGAR